MESKKYWVEVRASPLPSDRSEEQRWSGEKVASLLFLL